MSEPEIASLMNGCLLVSTMCGSFFLLVIVLNAFGVVFLDIDFNPLECNSRLALSLNGLLFIFVNITICGVFKSKVLIPHAGFPSNIFGKDLTDYLYQVFKLNISNWTSVLGVALVSAYIELKTTKLLRWELYYLFVVISPETNNSTGGGSARNPPTGFEAWVHFVARVFFNIVDERVIIPYDSPPQDFGDPTAFYWHCFYVWIFCVCVDIYFTRGKWTYTLVFFGVYLHNFFHEQQQQPKAIVLRGIYFPGESFEVHSSKTLRDVDFEERRDKQKNKKKNKKTPKPTVNTFGVIVNSTKLSWIDKQRLDLVKDKNTGQSSEYVFPGGKHKQLMFQCFYVL